MSYFEFDRDDLCANQSGRFTHTADVLLHGEDYVISYVDSTDESLTVVPVGKG